MDGEKRRVEVRFVFDWIWRKMVLVFVCVCLMGMLDRVLMDVCSGNLFVVVLCFE